MASNGKKKKKRIIIFSILGVAVIALILIVFLGSKKETILAVQVEEVSRRTITQVVTATGKIQPEVMVRIAPEVGGEIVRLPVREGQSVKKGDLLIKIDPETYVAQRDQASAGMLRAEAALMSAQPQYERMETLYRKGLVSQYEFDAAQADVESAKASLAQAKSSLNQAEESLRKTTVYSPMSGTVSQLNSELGERIIGAQFSGTLVMTIADLSRMEARVEVSENDVVLVAVGDTARISVDAFPDRAVNGVIYEIANSAMTTGLGTQEEVTNFEVKIRVVDKDISLRPGMSMTSDIETETKEEILAVPIQSVTTRMPKQEVKEGEEDGQSGVVLASDQDSKSRNGKKPPEVVFVVEDGAAKAVPVKRGISDDSHVEIVEGLEEGMKVVSGSYKAINRELEDGAKVRVKEPKEKKKEKAGGEEARS
ncbi:MAG: efflux RND transporter periplasmic adaptor subunit [Bacteroidota bacterium]